MNLRNRFLITAAVLCHLLLVPPLVTSQLPPASDEPAQARDSKPAKKPATAPTPCELAAAAQKEKGEGKVNTICAIQQEEEGETYKLHGAVEIHYGSFILRADEATYNSETKEATATGHFSLDGGPNDDHIRASHGTYNLELETGRFYDVVGTTGLRFRADRVILTSTSPFAFTGKFVEKTSPDHYVVYDGTITTCEVPRPKWQFDARKVIVDTGGNAKIYRSTFLLHGLPILYFPFATHPVQKDSRQSGFLMPSVAKSSTKGYVVGAAYYWAISRMMDATLGAEYFSLRGWSQRGSFRFMPGETSYVDLNYFGVIDRGIGSPPLKEGGENVRLNSAGTLDNGFRAVANIDYLSSFLFRLAFNEVFSQAVYSEVKSQGFLSKSENGFNINGFAELYQNFLSTTPGQVVKISHLPSVDVSSVDQHLGHTAFYWSFDASAAGLSRSEPELCSTSSLTPVCTLPFRTGLLGRFAVTPDISVPLLFRGWSVRPELMLHDTYYTEREPASGVGSAIGDPINLSALEAAVELRPPPLERVFDREFFGRKWKHVIEPRAVYRFVTGINDFSKTVKFDERDILSDTHEVEYGFVTRLYAKKTVEKPTDCKPDPNARDAIMGGVMVGGAAGESTIPWAHTDLAAKTKSALCPPAVREMVTWELAQKYFLDPTFGGALVPGQRNMFTTTADLTGIAFVVEPRHLSPIISRLRAQTTSRTDAEWDLDYDFQHNRVNASSLLANYHIGPVTMGGGDAILNIPVQSTASVLGTTNPTHFNQFRAALGYGRSNKRGFSAAGSFGFDAEAKVLQFVAVQSTYNWDCCGVTLEYRSYSVANVTNENLFRFTFTLADIGGFGSLRRQERLY